MDIFGGIYTTISNFPLEIKNILISCEPMKIPTVKVRRVRYVVHDYLQYLNKFGLSTNHVS